MIRILELFGGIGACSKALERLEIDYEIADYVEIDKYAVKSFNAIHNTNFEPQDICKWDKDIEVDLIMHGSPCQDFSLAGKQAGGDKDSGTRSSLMYETIRIVEKLKPKYVIWENVKNLLSKKHRHNFDAYLETMEQLGYVNYYQVLNAKDYGIPQNRERVFTVSILGNENFEFPKGVENANKIIEHNPKGKHQQDLIQDEDGLCRCIPAGTHGSTPHLLKTLVRNYEFPPKQELKLKLKDMLEDEVDEKYYLTEKSLEWLEEHNKNHKEKGTGFIFKPKNPNNDVANTIRANGSWCPTDNAFFEFPPKQELKLKLKDILEDEADEKYYLSDKIINKIRYKFDDENVLVGGMQKNQSIKKDGICTTLTSSMGTGGGYVPMVSRKYGVFDTEKTKHQAGSVYDKNGLSPTLDTMQGVWRQPCIEELGYVEKKYKGFLDEKGYIPDMFNPYIN